MMTLLQDSGTKVTDWIWTIVPAETYVREASVSYLLSTACMVAALLGLRIVFERPSHFCEQILLNNAVTD